MNYFKRNPTLENMVAFKRERARATRLIRENKKITWQNFVNTLRPDTPSEQIWRKIRTLTGKKVTDSPIVIQSGNQLVYEPKEISNILATQFCTASSRLTIHLNSWKLKKRQKQNT